MSNLEDSPQLAAALELARYGCWVFPLKPLSKKPAHDGWPAEVTRDPEIIRKLWGKRDFNVGIATAKYGHDGKRALLVVDVDVKNGKDGNLAIQQHEIAGNEFPPTMTSATPTGGRHLVYVVDTPVRQGVDVLGSAVDVRSSGGYIVGPGSVTADGSYVLQTATAHVTIADYTPADAPAWLIAACGKPRTKSADRTPLAGVDPARALKRGREYLANAPEAVSGAGGNTQTYTVATKLLALGMTPEAATNLLLDEYFEGCGWTATEMAEIVANAERYMQDPIGIDAPEAQFIVPHVEVDGVVDSDDALNPFGKINQGYSLVIAGADSVVYHERVDALTGQRIFQHRKMSTFYTELANQKLDGKPLAKLWLESNQRREYKNGVDFAPDGRVGAGVLNLWGGFAAAPVAGDWSLLHDHIREVIASNNDEIYRYLIGWMAMAVQKPGQPGEVAIVLRGGRGTGKSTFATLFGALFGQHYTQLDDPRLLTGTFNAHLGGRVLLFADEAYWAGNRAATPRLKSLITEKTMSIERKGVDVVTVRNATHLLLASNDDFVVPSGEDERRFCVLDVADSRRNDRAYFDAMRKQMRPGGPGVDAMLHYLINHDLSAFDIGRFPKTNAGTEQKLGNLRGTDRWFYEALSRQCLAGVEWDDGVVSVAKNSAYDDYRSRHKELTDYVPASNEAFWKRMHLILKAGGFALQMKRPGQLRERHVVFPSLADCRRALGAFLGERIEWTDDMDWGGKTHPSTPG